ncbi:MAG TPA: class I SAM-dependent methyltransferase, partial [Dehalococcoidia bacterium]|nr:class I SAM-dependent methyltransferase [Dehalococcoidia bacterium]
IGAGTGKATASLLARGARVTAVEAGPNMAVFLRRKFSTHDRLEVLNATFEDADLPGGAFDLVFPATSWHWVNPEVRLRRAHDVLAADGLLAIVSTNQIAAETDRGYFARSQAVYRRYFPEEDEPHAHGEDVVPEEFEEIRASPLFGSPELSRYRWDQTYSTEDYADLMRSYSNMQMMPEADRESLIGELSEVIDSEFGGSVTRPLVITLTLAIRE